MGGHGAIGPFWSISSTLPSMLTLLFFAWPEVVYQDLKFHVRPLPTQAGNVGRPAAA